MDKSPDETSPGLQFQPFLHSRKSAWRVAWLAPMVVGLALCPTSARADGLRIEEAIRLAVSNNEKSKIDDLNVVASEGQVESARGAFLPVLTFGAQGVEHGHQDRDGHTLTGAGTLTLRQPLLAPSAIPLYGRAKHNLAAQKQGSLEDQRALAFSTAQAFVQTLTAERVLKAAQGRFDRAKADLDDVQARVDAQLNSSNDATRAKLDLATAARSVTQDKGNLDRARLALGLLTGQVVDTPLEAPVGLSSAAKGFSGDPTRLVKAAVDTRPDLKQSQEQVLAAKDFASEPLYRLAPSIDAVGQVQGNPRPITGARADDETVTLSLSWTIFDGGVRYGDRKTRVAQEKVAEETKHLLTRTVDNDVRTALAALEASKDALDVAQQEVAAAELNSEETGILYKQGLVHALELTDANASRFDAEVQMAEARLDLINAYLGLRFAMGLDPVDPHGPGTASAARPRGAADDDTMPRATPPASPAALTPSGAPLTPPKPTPTPTPATQPAPTPGRQP